jgi:hypothetical protein
MSDDSEGGHGGIATSVMDVAVALLILALGVLVVVDSYRLGASWGEDGPQSGYFPFYIGALLCVAAIATLAQVALAEWKRRGQFAGAVAERRHQFVSWPQLRQVFAVLVPAAIYRAGRPVLRPLSPPRSTLRCSWWLGHLLVAAKRDRLGVSGLMFVMFEIWFKVPLYEASESLCGPAPDNSGASARSRRFEEQPWLRSARWLHGFAVVLSPFNLLLMLIGIVLRLIIGVLPGLGSANGVAISCP